MAPDRSAASVQSLSYQPSAFELCSAARTQALWEGREVVDPNRALPVSGLAWERLHNFSLALSPMAPTGIPWWLDLQLEQTTARTLLYVHPELPCFAGHFPGQPLLPGVVQLEWAMGLAHRVWPDTYPTRKFAGLARIKFKAPVEPGAVLTMQLDRPAAKPDAAADSSLTLSIKSPTETSTSARLLYRE